MAWIPGAAHAGIMAGVGAYALAKERRELGCRGWGASRRQCADEKSVYVRGTALRRDDTPADIRRKLVSVLSYHEKAGVWKRCFLLATALAYVSWIVRRASSPGWTFALTHLVFFCLLYFWFNYLNYHHFRRLKQHGSALAARLYKLARASGECECGGRLKGAWAGSRSPSRGRWGRACPRTGRRG